jgi:2'-5' RNA ligase
MSPARFRAAADGPTRRVFFALLPPAAAATALAALAAALAARVGGRVTETASIHLTLAFLGDVPAARLPDLEAIGAATAAQPAFTVALDTIGAFRKAQVAWVAPSAPPAGLLALASDLHGRLHGAGFAFDVRAFRPHVTLARKCTLALADERCAPVAWAADAVVLVASTLAPAGARYAALARWPLPPAPVTRPAPCS